MASPQKTVVPPSGSTRDQPCGRRDVVAEADPLRIATVLGRTR